MLIVPFFVFWILRIRNWIARCSVFTCGSRADSRVFGRGKIVYALLRKKHKRKGKKKKKGKNGHYDSVGDDDTGSNNIRAGTWGKKFRLGARSRRSAIYFFVVFFVFSFFLLKKTESGFAGDAQQTYTPPKRFLYCRTSLYGVVSVLWRYGTGCLRRFRGRKYTRTQ